MTAAADALAELKTSVLFADDFPRRIAHAGSQDEGASRPEDAPDPAVGAIRIVGTEWRRLRALVDRLGAARFEPAVPTLARLWRECALVPVCLAVGQALFDIGTDDAWDALEETIGGNDPFGRHMAVRAVFARDPAAAYDRLSSQLDPSGSPIARDVLALLNRDFEALGWRPLGGPYVERDNRRLRYCARLRDHVELGWEARRVLRQADADRLAAVMDGALADEVRVRPLAPPRGRRDGALLRRYEPGEYQAVWREIRAHPQIGGAFRDEVMEVAEATMDRVAGNADLLAERLRARGWRALTLGDGGLRTPPDPTDAAVLSEIEAITGAPVPPSLLAFWRVVGGINWVWDHEADAPPPDLEVDLPMAEMDPLCVASPRAVGRLFEEWCAREPSPHPAVVEPHPVELAPDALHKADISGGEPYAILLPTHAADPVFEFEPRRLPFIDYLRAAFRWAGFPGLEPHATQLDVRRFVADFGDGLAPF